MVGLEVGKEEVETALPVVALLYLLLVKLRCRFQEERHTGVLALAA